MVLTRSADKRIALNGKIEDLALRSKTDAQQSSEENEVTATSMPTPTPTTKLEGRKRGAISVNVPAKRQRLQTEVADTNSVAAEVEDDDSPYQTAIESPLTPRNVSAKSVPSSKSSQGNGQTTKLSEELHGEHTKHDEDDDEFVSFIETPKATVLDTVHGQSLDNTDASQVLVEPSSQRSITSKGEITNGTNDDGDDDAPEISTATRSPSTRGTRGTKRSTRKQAASNLDTGSQEHIEAREALVTKATVEHDITPEPSQHEIQDGDVVIPQQETPLPLHHTSHITFDDDDGRNAASQSSRTMSFGSATISAPRYDHDLTPRSRSDVPTTNSLSDANPRSSTPSLPSKAGNSLEKYRRQLLSMRAAKAKTRGRGGDFRLQDDWSTKRRKFVVTN